jgi:hypothetical protein
VIAAARANVERLAQGRALIDQAFIDRIPVIEVDFLIATSATIVANSRIFIVLPAVGQRPRCTGARLPRG